MALLPLGGATTPQTTFLHQFDDGLDEIRRVPRHIQNHMNEMTRHNGEVLDIKESLEDGVIIIKASMPGCKKDAIKVSVKEDAEGRKTLLIEGKTHQQDTDATLRKDDKSIIYHQEAYWNNRLFKNSTRIPSSAIADKIKAEYASGILTVVVPLDKKQRESTVNVDIK